MTTFTTKLGVSLHIWILLEKICVCFDILPHYSYSTYHNMELYKRKDITLEPTNKSHLGG